MQGGQEVYRSIELSDNVETIKLSILDQIRLIFAKLSNDDEAELNVAEKLSVDKLQKIAALNNFFEKAVGRLQELGKDSVTMQVSSEFLPYMDEVLPLYNKFYDIELVKKDIPVVIKHFVVIRISIKNNGEMGEYHERKI